MPSQEAIDEFTLIRQSPVLLFFRLLLIDLLFISFYVASRFPIERFYYFIGSIFQETIQTIWVGIVLFSVISFLQIFFTAWITLRWMNEYYIVRPGAVIHRRGVFRLIEETYSLKNVEAFTVKQSFIQRLCKYGHIQFYSPVLKQEYYLKNISNPVKIKEFIQELVQKDNPAQAIKEKIIPRVE